MLEAQTEGPLPWEVTGGFVPKRAAVKCETGVTVCPAGVQRTPQPFGRLGWGR